MVQILPLLLSTLLVPAAAHLEGIPGAPKLVGGRGLAADLRARPIFAGPPVLEKRPPTGPELKSRQIGGTSGQCGPGIGSCAAGYCCSSAGWCGNTEEYCEAPDCQYDYGPGCDTNISPPGASTSTIPRPHVGNILYGGGGVEFGGIYDCLQAGVVALTFDDGPYLYTSHILDVLASYNAKATFFITGNNLGKGRIDDPATGYPAIIQRMVREGHQIASHTWGHQNLSSMTPTKMKQQMYYNEMAFRNILGYFPTYMRPPYSQCSLGCESMLDSLGYHIVYFDFDTQDYLNDSPTLIQNSKIVVDVALQGAVPAVSNFLAIGHDIHEQTAYNLTGYLLDRMQALGFGTSVTVGQCLGDPSGNWYRSAGSAVPPPPPSSSANSTAATSKASTTSGATATGTPKTVTPDATCSGENGYTCQGSTFGSSSPFLSIPTTL